MLQLTNGNSLFIDKAQEVRPYDHRDQPWDWLRTTGRAMVRRAMRHLMLKLIVELDGKSNQRMRQQGRQG
jgi:hypothetical protein